MDSVIRSVYLVWAVAGACAAGTLLEAWRRRAWLPRALRWFSAYLILTLTGDMGQAVLGLLKINNHRVGYVVVPVLTACLLLAFAEWQEEARLRHLLRVLAPGCALFWLAPLFGLERTRDFSLLTSTVQALLIFAVATFTLIRRWLAAAAPPSGQDWFWVSSGAILLYGTLALVSPLNRYLMAEGERATALQVLLVRQGIAVIAMLLYWRGVRCVPLGDPGRLVPAPAS